MGETINFGSIKLKFLQSREETDGIIDCFEMTVMPNGRMPVPHYHESWEETIVGLSGTTTWRIGDETSEVGPGESLFIKRGVVHGFDNKSDAPAKCLCILTPGALGPSYFLEVAAVVKAGAPEPARMKDIMLRYGLVPVPQGG